NTLGDLKWMRGNGLEAAVKKLAEDIPVFGICGGYQMLGEQISDPTGVEGGGTLRGMELLPVVTKLGEEKVRCRIEGKLPKVGGVFSNLSGLGFAGYEIHMGKTKFSESGKETENRKDALQERKIIVSGRNPNVYGTYVHGIFDKGCIATAVVQALAEKKGILIGERAFEDYQSFKEKQYDKLADTLREYLNMEEIYGMLREARLG
ncbi:MAG: cobyric acid synthase CobQ, partial [Lachnospiraceae bacterium]